MEAFDAFEKDRVLSFGRFLDFQSTVFPADVEVVSGEQRVAFYGKSTGTVLSVGSTHGVGCLGEPELLFSPIGTIDPQNGHGVLGECVR